MNTGFWNMDSGLAAVPRPGMTAIDLLIGEGDRAVYSTDSTHS